MKRILITAVMLGLTGGAYAADFGDLQGLRASSVALGDISVPAVDRGYVGSQVSPVEYITINGGKFTMGADSYEPGLADAKPTREVAIKTFKMAKTDVTVAQYAECVIKGACTEPDADDYCNWGKPGRENHPVNCVDWSQAQAYAKF